MHNDLATFIISGKLTTVPIGKTPQRIFDVGCGFGIWSMDTGKNLFPTRLRMRRLRLTHVLGDEYPSA